MSSYSSIERNIALALSKAPFIKKIVKRSYSILCYFLYKSNKKIILSEDYDLVVFNELTSSFFGYYDKSPVNDNSTFCIYHETLLDTSKKIPPGSEIDIVIYDIDREIVIAKVVTKAFNWQQGSKLQWISENKFIYNDRDDKSYISRVYDVDRRSVTDSYSVPIYDCFRDEFALSLSFEMLTKYSPDYGYYYTQDYDLPDISNDGVLILCLKTKVLKLLVSINEIINLSSKKYNANYFLAIHTINHIMISPDGSSFIFIHRWYQNNERKDRLIYSSIDGTNIKVLSDEGMVSHCCWESSEFIVGYLRNSSLNNYYRFNCNGTGFEAFGTKELTSIGDGHPSIKNNKFLTDSYPDKSSMQSLILIDMQHNKELVLGRFLHPIKFHSSNRCDLHPRFSTDGKLIFIDSVFSGNRQFCMLKNRND